MDQRINLVINADQLMNSKVTNLRTRKDFTLGYLVDKWLEFVKEVRQGYDLTIYDYTNDLSSRDFLEDVLNMLAENQKDELLAVVGPIDEIFLSETNVTDLTLMGESEEAYSEKPWWYRRLPNNLVGELKEDVESLERHG